jgi:acyl-CoA synthetase (AMP-forming)/AMP-acid ligase II
MIISGGENISSSEVERALYEHPAISEVAVVARPDERWNETPVAYVVARGTPPDSDELTSFCRERLSGYKVPKGFRFVQALPRNPSGKVLKRELRELEQADAGS